MSYTHTYMYVHTQWFPSTVNNDHIFEVLGNALIMPIILIKNTTN